MSKASGSLIIKNIHLPVAAYLGGLDEKFWGHLLASSDWMGWVDLILKMNVLCGENFPRGSPNFKINILCLIVVNYDHY